MSAYDGPPILGGRPQPARYATCPTCGAVAADEGDGLLTAAGAVVQAGDATDGQYVRVQWSSVVNRAADPTGTVVAQLRRLARVLERDGIPGVPAMPPAVRQSEGQTNRRRAVDTTAP